MIGLWLAARSGDFGGLPLLRGGMIQLIASSRDPEIGGKSLVTSGFLAIIGGLYPSRERPHRPHVRRDFRPAEEDRPVDQRLFADQVR